MRVAVLLTASIVLIVPAQQPPVVAMRAESSRPTVGSVERIRFNSLDELLAVAPPPPRSQELANEMMGKLSGDPDFADVMIEGDNEIVIAMRGADETVSVVDGITVRTVSTRYSLNDLDAFARKLGEENPAINEVSYDVLNSTLSLVTDSASIHSSGDIRRRGVPSDVALFVVKAPPPELHAAEGGMLSNGSGCTTGFRVKSGSPPVWRLTSANHSACSTWTTVNGVTMTLQSNVCVADTSFASGGSLGLGIGGNAYGGVQGNPASGSLVYKYGVVTGWTYGYRGVASTSTFSCTVPIYRYSGGNISSSPGDSGGPYISLVWNGSAYVYQARGTHRGTSAGLVAGVRMSSIIATGWSVG